MSHRSLGRLERACEPKAGRELMFRFRSSASLTVTVSGLEQVRRKEGEVLYLNLKTHMEPDKIAGMGTRASSVGNVFVFDDLQPGPRFLVLASPHGQGFVDRLPITLSEGENRIEWALPRLHTVRLDPAKKERSLRFGMTRLDSAGNWLLRFASSAKGGDVEFGLVPAGSYELFGTYDGESRRIPIVVPGQTHVRLE